MPPVSGSNQGNTRFWRSLDDLAQTDRFRALLSKEFADYEPDQVLSMPTRRRFMKLMGGSMALAGVAGLGAGCRRWPESQLAPHNAQPEGAVPGVPQQYASMWELGGVAIPLLVNSYDGRPTKVEGNPTHPASLGASEGLTQATILDMYDPARSRVPLHAGERSTWDAFDAVVAEMRANGGAGLAILSEPSGSLTLKRLRDKFAQSLPQAKWFEWDPINRDNQVSGAPAAEGRPLRPHLHLDRADVIFCLDADILSGHPDSLRHARGWAARRRTADQGQMSRMWCVDSSFTVTSTNADERLALRDSQLTLVGRELAAALGVAGVTSGEGLSNEARQFVARAAADLTAAGSRALVVAGADQPAALQTLCWAINQKLGSINTTVTFTEEPAPAILGEQITALVAAMNDGQVSSIIIVGGNPIYDAPADLRFGEALAKVATKAHLSPFLNETSAACDWNLPLSHYLECWGDGRSWDGTVTLQQPLILPLYESRSAIEVIARLLGEPTTAGYELVRETFRPIIPADTFERNWRKALHDGFLGGSGYAAVTPGEINPPAPLTAPSSAGVELILRPGYALHDGRFAGNAWLQELPDPLTKLTWDNAALIGPATAEDLDVGQGELISISSGSTSIQAPVFIMPGQARGTISLALGYGRTRAGEIGTNIGFDAYPLRRSSAMRLVTNVTVSPTGRRHPLATTQDHHAIDKVGLEEIHKRAFGNIVRSVTLEDYKHELNAGGEGHTGEPGGHGGGHGDPTNYKAPMHVPAQPGTHLPLQIIDENKADEYNGYKWGMSIDLASCIGCGGCVVACQAENNIPVVGKQAVIRGREMHWLRIDRYFSGVTENPTAVHQPLTCHHCETAPCEQVCPVAATVHDTEGLNVMIYNRCIGTRYCSNNCPYKVRRFNWFDWHAKPVHGGDHTGTYLGFPDEQQRDPAKIDPIRRMQFNPDVTVRMRGVMEKCTFCIQRIKSHTIPAKNAWARQRAEGEQVPDDGWRLPDGAVTPACAQACPTRAIRFGDLNLAGSAVATDFESRRAYELLKEMNVRARTRYLARVTNPAAGSPETADAEGGHA